MRLSPATLLVLAVVFLLTACGQEKKGPSAAVFKEVKFKKVVVWVEKGSVLGHFGIVNEHGKELAMTGTVTLEFFAESSVNVQGGPAFEVKSPILQARLPVKLEDFQWIYYHSFMTDDDFVCRFKVPLSQFKVRPAGGRFVKFKITFKPDAHAAPIEMEKRVWFPQ